MSYQDIAYSVFALLITGVYIAIINYAWTRRKVPGASALTLVMIGAGAYAIPYMLQLSSPDLQTALMWYLISLPGASIVGPAWLIFALQYTRQENRLSSRLIFQLSIIPFVICIAAWTNSLHGLYGSDFRFDANAAWPILEWKFGLFYWVNFVYAYITTFVGMAILVWKAVKRIKLYSYQTFMLLAGAVVPLITNLLFVLGYTPVRNVDFSPFGFILTGLFWSLAIFRFHLLDIIPLARGRVFEIMPIGVIVLDEKGRVLDVNPAADSMFDPTLNDLIGRPIGEVLPSLPVQSIQSLKTERLGEEISIERVGGRSFYSLHQIPIRGAHGSPSGSFLLLYDITRRKRAELAEREQRLLAETLRDTASTLNRVLIKEELLDHVLNNLYKIVPFDAAHVILLDAVHQKVKLSRFNKAFEETREGYGISFNTHMEYPVELLEEFNKHPRSFLFKDVPQFYDIDGLIRRKWVAASAGMPIISRGEMTGFITVDSALPNFFTHIHLQRLDAFANQAAIAIENMQLYEEVKELSLHDELTGILNRRGLIESGQKELRHAHRLKYPVTLLMFDLDGFKGINDTYGHAAGDAIMKAVVQCCQDKIREIDLLGRYGGDEFIIILPGCNREAAHQVASRLCRMIDAIVIPFDAGSLHVTISVGMALNPPEGISLEELIQRADQALYAAKEGGKNTVRWPAE